MSVIEVVQTSVVDGFSGIGPAMMFEAAGDGRAGLDDVLGEWFVGWPARPGHESEQEHSEGKQGDALCVGWISSHEDVSVGLRCDRVLVRFWGGGLR